MGLSFSNLKEKVKQLVFVTIVASSPIIAQPPNSEVLVTNELKGVHSVITINQLQSVISDEFRFNLFDTRSKEDFEKAHLVGARHISKDISLERIWMYDRKSVSILYGDNQAHIDAIAKNLIQLGFSNVRQVNGDLIDFINAGIEIEGTMANRLLRQIKRKNND